MRYFKNHPNQKKYLLAPTPEQVMKVVNGYGVTMAQFERYYGMNEDYLRQIKHGYRKLAPKFWHIIFENLKKIEAGQPLQTFKPPPPNNYNNKKKSVKKNELISNLL